MSYEKSLRRNLGMHPDNHCQCKYYMMTLERAGGPTSLRLAPEERYRIVAFVYAPAAEDALKLTRAFLNEQGQAVGEDQRIVARELGKAGEA